MEISIDSYNFDTLQYLMNKLPISWINDQTGFADERIIDLVKNTNLKLVVMHHITIPVDPTKTLPEEIDVTSFIKEWLLKKANYLIERGIRKEQIILDPGIGFGKTAQQSWRLIRNAKILANLGYPIMYGHSRKSFLGLLTDKPFAERDLETAVLSSYLSAQGVDYLRVHDVESSARAIKANQYLYT